MIRDALRLIGALTDLLIPAKEMPRAYAATGRMESDGPDAADVLVSAEERDEVLAPWYSDGGPTEWLGDKNFAGTAASLAGGESFPHVGRVSSFGNTACQGGQELAPRLPVTPINPAGAAAQSGVGGTKTAPGVPSPPVAADAPGRCHPPGADQGQPAELVHLVTDGVTGIHSGDGDTSDLLYAAANQLANLRDVYSCDSIQHRYLGELIPDLRDRAAQFEAIGD